MLNYNKSDDKNKNINNIGNKNISLYDVFHDHEIERSSRKIPLRHSNPDSPLNSSNKCNFNFID